MGLRLGLGLSEPSLQGLDVGLRLRDERHGGREVRLEFMDRALPGAKQPVELLLADRDRMPAEFILALQDGQALLSRRVGARVGFRRQLERSAPQGFGRIRDFCR